MAKLDYYNLTLRGLSYSRSLVLHQCPRKYQLDATQAIKTKRTSVTFSYGHAVAAGIQATIAGASYDRAMVECMMAYSHDIDDIGDEGEQRAKKNIWWALLAVDLFHKKYKAGQYGYLRGWEIARFEHPTTGEMIDGVELTFVVDLVDGFSYEGHIDLVLYHPEKNKLMVLELKTTGSTRVDEASYKNSAQALGYGVVLDSIADFLGAEASFDVVYLVFQSRNQELTHMIFTKSLKLRVDWMTLLMADMKMIEVYEEIGFPKHGESCFDFYRPCGYMDHCNLSDDTLATIMKNDGKDEAYSQMTEPTFMFTLEQLMDRQNALIDKLMANDLDDKGDVDLLLDATMSID